MRPQAGQSPASAGETKSLESQEVPPGSWEEDQTKAI